MPLTNPVRDEINPDRTNKRISQPYGANCCYAIVVLLLPATSCFMLIGAQRAAQEVPKEQLAKRPSPVPLVPSEQELKLRTGEGRFANCSSGLTAY